MNLHSLASGRRLGALLCAFALAGTFLLGAFPGSAVNALEDTPAVLQTALENADTELETPEPEPATDSDVEALPEKEEPVYILPPATEEDEEPGALIPGEEEDETSLPGEAAEIPDAEDLRDEEAEQDEEALFAPAGLLLDFLPGEADDFDSLKQQVDEASGAVTIAITGAIVLEEDLYIPENTIITLTGGTIQIPADTGLLVIGALVLQDTAATGPGQIIVYGTLTMRGTASMTGGIGTVAGAIGVASTGRLEMYDNSRIADSVANVSSESSYSGGGVFAEGNVYMYGDSRIENNTGYRGGGIAISSTGSLTMADSSAIIGNTANGSGGGVYASGNVTMLNSSRMEGNQALGTGGHGGAIHAENSTVTISLQDNASIVGNTATNYGGGIRVSNRSSTITLSGAAIVQDNVAQGRGGGIYSDGAVILRGTASVYNNQASNYGGGVASQELAMYDSSSISYNRLPTNTNSVFGGGVYVGTGSSGNGSMTMWDNSSVHNNAAESGGGIHVSPNSTLYMQDGAPAIHSNEAKQGGGIFAAVTASSGVPDIQLSSGSIHSNTATSNGGGIYTIQGNIGGVAIYGNTATSDGGGVYTSGSNYTAAFTGAQIYGNRAGRNGGGVYKSSQTTLTIQDSAITGNQADGAGGGLYADAASSNTRKSPTSITASTLSGNRAGTNGGAIMLGRYQEAQVDGSFITNNYAAADGGGVMPYNLASLGSFTTDKTAFSGNVAGNGVFLMQDTSAYVTVHEDSIQNLVSVSVNGTNYAYNNHDIFFNENGVVSVVYHLNDGSQTTFTDVADVSPYLALGFVATGMPLEDGDVFVEWTTEADGSGTAYQPGETVAGLPASGTYHLYAQIDVLPSYLLTFVADGAPVVPEARMVRQGAVLPVVADPDKDGFTFDGWYDDEDAGSLVTLGVDTMPSEPLTLYARYIEDIKDYELHINYGQYADEANLQSITVRLEAGDALPVPVYAELDDVYIYAFVDETNTEWNFPNTMPARDLKLTAKWRTYVEVSYRYFQSGTGGAPGQDVTIQSYKLKAGDVLPADVVAPSFTGWHFVGWFNQPFEAAGDVEYTLGVDTIGETPLQVYARYALNTHQLIIKDDDTTYRDEMAPYGLDIVLPHISQYEANGWQDQNGNVYMYTDTITMPDHALTLTPMPVPVPKYWLELDYNNGIQGVEKTEHEFGDVLYAPTAIAPEGHYLEGWFDENDLQWFLNGTTNVMPPSDVSLVARWKPSTYKVTFNAAGGTPTPDVQYVVYNTLIATPATPVLSPGHTLVSWFTEDGSAWNFGTNTMPAGDITLYARYTPRILQLTFDFNDEGATNPEYRQVAYGTSFTAPQVSRSGYTLRGWYTPDGSQWSFAANTMPHYDLTLRAEWDRVETSVPETTSRTPEETTTSRGNSGGGGTSSAAPTTSTGTSSTSTTTSASTSTSSSSSSSAAAGTASVPAASQAVPEESSEAPVETAESTVEFRSVETLAPDYIEPNGSMTLGGVEIPMGGIHSRGGWSLFNLIIGIATLISALVHLLVTLRKRKGGAPASVWTWVAIASGVLPLLLFLPLENFSQMILFSRWTPLIGALVAVHIFTLIITSFTTRAASKTR